MSKQLYIVFFVCVFCLYSNAQTSLLINVVDSATNEKRVLANVHLIKDGRTKIIDNQTLQSKFLVDNLDSGKWTIRYDSYFFNFKEIDVDLIPDKQNTLTLYIQSIKPNPKKQLFLDQLTPNDSLSFIISLSACFRSWTDSLIIRTINNKKTAYYKGNMRELDEADFSILRQFESQLYLVKDEGSTTLFTYRGFHGKKKTKNFHSSGDWHFGERIVSYLFPLAHEM